VTSGLKQGCLLSPLIFNLFVNDLSDALEDTDLGINLDGIDCKLNMLLYADDLALIAESEEDLQRLLQILSKWCEDNGMTINMDKTKVIHYRNPSKQRTDFSFTFANQRIDVISSYRYLGLVLEEHLNYDVTAKAVAKAASRALGLVISKSKSAGGLPYSVFTKLYDTVVWPTISYGASIWGTKEYSCINAVQNRACRYFLGVGKYAPNNGVNGDMGWMPPVIKQWKCVIRNYWRLKNMSDDRINKQVFVWMCNKSNLNCKNWNFRIQKQLELLQINGEDRNAIFQIETRMFALFKGEWKRKIESNRGTRPNQSNKLRTYRNFKTEYVTERYVKVLLSKSERSAMAKFRCGVAPLRIETGRFERLPVEQRLCFHCSGHVEDELHVLTECPLYQDLRDNLYERASDVQENFSTFSNLEKLSFIMSSNDLVKISAKTCNDILIRRRNFIFNFT
ncbi:MAG: reverse transcriptase family protein, partial [Candidatus Thiodiazotropha sp.]